MNHLNSILIEGTLLSEPIFEKTASGTSFCFFRIASDRFYKTGDSLIKEQTEVFIQAWAYLAETCKSVGHIGKAARIIGRLCQNQAKNQSGEIIEVFPPLFIVAEHIEFRTKINKENPNGSNNN